MHKTPSDTSKAVDEFMKSLPSFKTTEYFATTNLRTKKGIGLVLHFGAKVRTVAATSLDR